MASGKHKPGPATESETSKDLLTTKQAADILGVGTTSIKRWSDEGKLPAYKTAGGHRRYRRADVENMMGDGLEPMASQSGLAKMSRAEIDTLAVGVIQLDDAGYVLLYNRTESKFSGIDSKDAEGQHFFGQLAPCTNNKIVYGQFQKAVRGGVVADIEIPYTFTYRMRPTHVTLRIQRDPVSGTNWIIVQPTSL